MDSKVLVEGIIEKWNHRLISKDHSSILKIKENISRGKNVTEISITIKLLSMGQSIFRATWAFQEVPEYKGGYEHQLELALESVYSSLLENILMSGLNASAKDWVSGRLIEQGNQVIINPTADEILAKLGIKLSTIR